MKRDQKVQQEFKKIKNHLYSLRTQAQKAPDHGLWHVESVVRNRLRALDGTAYRLLKEHREVYEGYIALLDEISERILRQHNKKNGTSYVFSVVRNENIAAYIRSGILSVLVSSHIPRLVADEFTRLLPRDPKDEYPRARALHRVFHLHLGETNTGKTYQALQRLMQAQQGIYLSPLRILALENYERMNAQDVPCHLLTGEEEILVEGAQHVSCTVEKLDITKSYQLAVVDEVQLCGDAQRGDAWTRAILGLECPEIHLCGALSAKEQLLQMILSCGDEAHVTEYVRSTPLQVQHEPVSLRRVQKGDALVVFSKRGVQQIAQRLLSSGIHASVIYGDLPPEVRKMQYAAFLSGENPVLVSTDAIGLGVNLPIRRIIFTSTSKFDGQEIRPLTSQEVKQIAGRAGRLGLYDVGYVACAENEADFIQMQLDAEDEPVSQAVVGPSELLLQIKLLPLKEKLALWETQQESLPCYRKKDVRDYLLILDHIKSFQLPESVQWQLMRIPFDVNREELLFQFMTYMELCFLKRKERLPRPYQQAQTLPACELFYQQLNLYYSFSKTMGLPFDYAWLQAQRARVCAAINRML